MYTAVSQLSTGGILSMKSAMFGEKLIIVKKCVFSLYSDHTHSTLHSSYPLHLISEF